MLAQHPPSLQKPLHCYGSSTGRSGGKSHPNDDFEDICGNDCIVQYEYSTLEKNGNDIDDGVFLRPFHLYLCRYDIVEE
jgi:hypothetical protein